MFASLCTNKVWAVLSRVLGYMFISTENLYNVDQTHRQAKAHTQTQKHTHKETHTYTHTRAATSAIWFSGCNVAAITSAIYHFILGTSVFYVLMFTLKYLGNMMQRITSTIILEPTMRRLQQNRSHHCSCSPSGRLICRPSLHNLKLANIFPCSTEHEKELVRDASEMQSSFTAASALCRWAECRHKVLLRSCPLYRQQSRLKHTNKWAQQMTFRTPQMISGTLFPFQIFILDIVWEQHSGGTPTFRCKKEKNPHHLLFDLQLFN